MEENLKKKDDTPSRLRRRRTRRVSVHRVLPGYSSSNAGVTPEDTRALRLVSELPDLRAGYADRIPLRPRDRGANSNLRIAAPKTKKTSNPNGFLVVIEV